MQSHSSIIIDLAHDQSDYYTHVGSAVLEDFYLTADFVGLHEMDRFFAHHGPAVEYFLPR